MKRYYVVDWFEGVELLSATNDYNKAFAIADKREGDTDYECDVFIYDTQNPKDLAKLKMHKIFNK